MSDDPTEEVISMGATDAGVSAVTQRSAVVSLSFMARRQQHRSTEDGGA